MDIETGLYVIYEDGKIRYYDPVLMMYLDAETSKNVFDNIKFINGLDKNSITVENIINITSNRDNKCKSLWDIHKQVDLFYYNIDNFNYFWNNWRVVYVYV